MSAARGGPRLFAFEDGELAQLAGRHGTPCFVYRASAVSAAWTALRAALPPRVRVAYAVKANPHPALLAHLAALGASFDCASLAELQLAAAALAQAGAPPARDARGTAASRLFFAGPGKQRHEIGHALALGARLQVEGAHELRRLDELENLTDAASHVAGQRAASRGGATARAPAAHAAVNLRVHPRAGVEEERPILGGAGPSAFGVDEEDVPAFLEACSARDRARVAGLHVFAASNERDARRLLATHAMVLAMARDLQERLQRTLEQVDLGGGLGVPYAPDEAPLDLDQLGRGLRALLDEHSWFEGDLVLEPGRFLAAACGVYLARVVRTKMSRGVRFAVLQGGLNHLARPQLTGQPFPVRRVEREPFPVLHGGGFTGSGELLTVLAGPLCTSLDRLGQVPLPADLGPGDLLAFGMAGAYGATEALTRFLSHPGAKEAWVEESPLPGA